MTGFGRRTFIVAGAAIGALSLVGPASAGDKEAADAVAWLIGDNLSLGALLYARGADAKNVDAYLGQARAIARNISIEIPDFPAKGADATATTADMIHYLIAGDGWHVGEIMQQTYGPSAGVLFEVAVKSNILILLYQPGDDSGIGDIIKSRLDGLLPANLWQPVTDAIAAKASEDAMQNAVLTMHQQVADYLIKAAS